MKLKVENLVVDRGIRRVLEGVSFSLSAGQSMTLRGRNGSGKTTLIRTIAGFIAPVSGSIAIEDDALEPDQPVAESCHYVGHLNGTKAALTVFENLQFWASYLGAAEPVDRSSADTCEEALTKLELLELADIPAQYLSAGQKRRLGLARLLVVRRPIWLLDEPTVSLDAQSVELLANAIKDHVSNGGITIAATHIPLGLDDTRDMHLEQMQSSDRSGPRGNVEVAP